MLVIWFVWESIVHGTIDSVNLYMSRLRVYKINPSAKCEKYWRPWSCMEEERQEQKAENTPLLVSRPGA